MRFRSFRPGARAQDGLHAVGLALPFEPRREVHAIAQRRIVEALRRAHVADAADARVEADAAMERYRRPAGRLRFGGPFAVAVFHPPVPPPWRPAGVPGMPPPLRTEQPRVGTGVARPVT